MTPLGKTSHMLCALGGMRAGIALAGLAALAWLGGCDSDPGGPPTPTVASVTISPASATLLVQTTRQLSATVRDANGTELPGRPVTWRSGNAAVATVDANGMVTAVSAGSAAVIATSEGVSNTAAITVTTTISFLSVSAGGEHTCGLAASGAYCWGYNGSGQLGDGRATGPETCRRRNEDRSCSTVPVAVTGGLTFSAVTAGPFLTCGLTTSGAPYCWGSWADRFTSSSSVPVAVPGGHEFSAVTVGGWLGPPHACGLTTTGAVYCWGNNYFGQLGDGTTSGPEYCLGWGCRSVPVAVVGGLSFAAVSAGGDHTCGLTTGGTAYCWGDNEVGGQLGDGSYISKSIPVAVAGGLTFSTVSAGMLHTCGLTTSGAAYCWGHNGAGELGDGTATDRWVPVAVSGGLTFSAITAGALHTCGLTTSGEAYCWGYSVLGQLGTGAATGPDQCLHQYEECYTRPAAVAGGLTFKSLSAGGERSCGITVSSIAYCWGSNYFGQLGTGDATGPEQCAVDLACSTKPVAVARQTLVP